LEPWRALAIELFLILTHLRHDGIWKHKYKPKELIAEDLPAVPLCAAGGEQGGGAPAGEDADEEGVQKYESEVQVGICGVMHALCVLRVQLAACWTNGPYC
jgi:hypothetical protein